MQLALCSAPCWLISMGPGSVCQSCESQVCAVEEMDVAEYRSSWSERMIEGLIL